jgi:hypothetical protein
MKPITTPRTSSFDKTRPCHGSRNTTPFRFGPDSDGDFKPESNFLIMNSNDFKYIDSPLMSVVEGLYGDCAFEISRHLTVDIECAFIFFMSRLSKNFDASFTTYVTTIEFKRILRLPSQDYTSPFFILSSRGSNIYAPYD